MQLAAEVIDFDGLEQSVNPNDLVDRFMINMDDLTLGADFPDSAIYNGVFGFGFLYLSFRVKCADHFYGADCDVFCQARDDSQGHYTCDSGGNRICLEGFQDPVTGCTQRCTRAVGCCELSLGLCSCVCTSYNCSYIYLRACSSCWWLLQCTRCVPLS